MSWDPDELNLDLPPLPWDEDALQPWVSARAVRVHYRMHHAAYCEKVAALVGDPAAKLADVVLGAKGKLFDLAAQAWNHSFFWRSLRPVGTKDALRDARAFAESRLGRLAARSGLTSPGALSLEVERVASEHFGSGWTWVVHDVQGDCLEVVNTHDAGTPLATGAFRPLLVVDLWEHSYYLDHLADRAAYVRAVARNILDLTYADSRLV